MITMKMARKAARVVRENNKGKKLPKSWQRGGRNYSKYLGKF